MPFGVVTRQTLKLTHRKNKCRVHKHVFKSVAFKSVSAQKCRVVVGFKCCSTHRLFRILQHVCLCFSSWDVEIVVRSWDVEIKVRPLNGSPLARGKVWAKQPAPGPGGWVQACGGTCAVWRTTPEKVHQIARQPQDRLLKHSTARLPINKTTFQFNLGSLGTQHTKHPAQAPSPSTQPNPTLAQPKKHLAPVKQR